MTRLYVSTDAHGAEHAATGTVHWRVPVDGTAGEEADSAGLVLRRPVALLDVLDERIFEAEPSDGSQAGEAATLEVTRARLVHEANWNSEMAVTFALACAERVARSIDVTLPDGSTASAVIDEARHDLDAVCEEHGAHLGRLARISALRRLKREQKELSGLLTAELVDDEARDLDALDDPLYGDLRTVIDSVLAAVEALRHHAAPHLYVELEEEVGEAEAHHNLDRRRAMQVGIVSTPWGTAYSGGTVLRFEPAWEAAVEAARHARDAVESASGPDAARAERAWQGGALERLLTEPS